MKNGDHIYALTTSTVYNLSTTSFSEIIEFHLAHLPTMFEGPHYVSVFSMVCILYLIDVMKRASADLDEALYRRSVRKLGISSAIMVYIRPLTDEIVVRMKDFCDLHSLFRTRFHIEVFVFFSHRKKWDRKTEDKEGAIVYQF